MLRAWCRRCLLRGPRGSDRRWIPRRLSVMSPPPRENDRGRVRGRGEVEGGREGVAGERSPAVTLSLSHLLASVARGEEKGWLGSGETRANHLFLFKSGSVRVWISDPQTRTEPLKLVGCGLARAQFN